MSNRSYLTASNVESIYPSFAEKKYDPSKQLIASDVENLPLLWLALFREDDLQRKVFKLGGDEVPAFAPICSKEKALRQLDEAIPYLSKIFPKLGRLEEYAAMFRSAIVPLTYHFVSIELEEIAGLYPEEHRFEEILTLALRGFTNPKDIRFQCDDVTIDFSGMQISAEAMPGDEEDEELMEEIRELNSGPGIVSDEKVTIEGFTANSHSDILIRLTSLRDHTRLPSVRMYLDDLSCTEDEQWNFTRILGVGFHGSMGYGREVPWEKEDANFGFEFIATENDDDE